MRSSDNWLLLVEPPSISFKTSEMTFAQDPFYIVKDEIQESVSPLVLYSIENYSSFDCCSIE